VAVPGWHRALAGQVVRFGAIGVASTAAYLLLFLLLHPTFGAPAGQPDRAARHCIGKHRANRRFTFGLRGARPRDRHQLQGLVVFALGLGLTSGALALMSALVSQPSRWLEVGVLIVANLAATVLRFVLLREWVFRPQAEPSLESYR
jgi:putative flippase GtrA